MRYYPLALVMLWLACDTAPEPDRPNIIYILADDLGYGDLQCYNKESKIPTPNIDRLAAEGMRFTDAHAPASICTPTRYGILTGRYCWRTVMPTGVLRGYGRALLEDERTTVAEMLKDHGYHTGVIGKWHLGLDWVIKDEYQDSLSSEKVMRTEKGLIKEMSAEYIDFFERPTDGPLNHGFDYSFILPASLDMDPYCFLENDSLTQIPDNTTSGNDLNTGYIDAFWRAGRIAPDFEIDQVLPTFAEKAISFMHDHNGDPFFLYLPLASPHTPWVPTDTFRNKSQAGQYGDFTHMVDHMVGRVLDALSELGLADETLVVFTSDNGPFWTPELIDSFDHRAAGELRGMKADAWEGGHRVPFIVRWPGVTSAGSTTGALTSLTNLFATCAEMLGLELKDDEGEDSHSVLSVLKGDTDDVPGQDALVQHSSRDYFVVRQGPWKLITGLGSGGFSRPSVVEAKDEMLGQLYHLNQDPGERENRFLQHPEKVKELSTLLQRYRDTGRSR